MKRSLLIAVFAAVMITGAMAAAIFDRDSASLKPQKTTITTYRTLENGTIVYEEITADETSLPEIAPAAGTGDGPAQPQFKYDPLTQTYRRSTVDIQGNPRQDIINTNN